LFRGWDGKTGIKKGRGDIKGRRGKEKQTGNGGWADAIWPMTKNPDTPPFAGSSNFFFVIRLIVQFYVPTK